MINDEHQKNLARLDDAADFGFVVAVDGFNHHGGATSGEIRQVKLNPFEFSGAIRGVLIKETNGEPFLSWDEAYGNFQVASFFGHPWVFKELRASKPFVRVQMNGDGTFNFSDILTKFSTNAPPSKKPTGPAKQLAVRIDQIEVSDAVLSLILM